MTTQSRAGMTPEERKVLIASSLGTVFEWYDFILFGAIAPVVAKQFFAKADPATALIFALLAFAAGFIVRPFGALVFGRLGDLVGRKYTFLVTIVIMGFASFAVGLLPNYDSIGIAAPIMLISLRLLQGLAVGGEYGGAAVYVAEHAPANRRGEFTAWIQTTGTLGLLGSLLVILGCRTALGVAAFADWGWRVPFLLSIILLAISVWIRLSMTESPAFARMKAAGTTSKAPLSEAFGRWENLKIVLIALFGLIAGFGVLWYTSQFYVLLFLTQALKVDGGTANVLVCIALALGTPFIVGFGMLSDRIGRKKIMLIGMLLAALTVFPIFKGLTHFANPVLEKALASAPVVVTADPADCQFQFNLTGTKKFTSSCDIVKAKLVAASVHYSNEVAPAGTVASVKVGDKVLTSFDAGRLPPAEAATREAAFSKELGAAIQAAGYPAKADPAQINKPMITLLLFILVVYIAMAYGPAAAILVEMFPTRIRYTSLSLPYHVGTGWFGGLMPSTAFALVAYHGDIYSGLWYPVVILLATVLIGALFVKETKDVDINASEHAPTPGGGSLAPDSYATPTRSIQP
jgi:MFS family permease